MCVVAAPDKQRMVVIAPTQKNPSKHQTIFRGTNLGITK